MKARTANQPTFWKGIAHFFTAEINTQIVWRARGFFLKVWHYSLVVFLAWTSYVTINHHVLSTIRVSGSSMRPTLRDSDVLLLNRWTYLWRLPRPGDIAVIKDPSDGGYSIKRVIARPGDFVCVKDGEVFVNGKRLAEPYLPKETRTELSAGPSAQWMIGCKAGEYVLLGDNRDNSLDSRYYGTVPRKNILGAVFP